MKHLIFIALIFFLALPCAGQEGRGQWVKTEQSFEFTTGESAYMFWWFDSLSSPDSVWVPEQCHKDTSGDWYMQLILPPDSLIVRIRLDTLWQVAESVWIERDY